MAKGGKGRKGGGGGGGKTRKYSRDNNGRFAATGTGATARGGRLLTAKGNKRKTQTITAAGKKGVLAKPKGLKPGSIKPKAAGNKIISSPRRLSGDQKIARDVMTNKKLTSDRQRVAEMQRRGIKPGTDMVGLVAGVRAKQGGDSTSRIKPAAKPSAASAPIKKRVRTDGAAFAERNKRTSRIELKRSLKESDRENALTSDQRRKIPVSKRMAQNEEKTNRAKQTASKAKEFYQTYGSEATFGRRPKLSTAGGAKFGSKVKAAAKPTRAAGTPKTGQEVMKSEVRKVQNKRLRDLNADIKSAGPNATSLRVEKLALKTKMIDTQPKQTAKQLAKSAKQDVAIRGRIAEMRKLNARVSRAQSNKTKNADVRNSTAPMSKASFARRPGKKTMRSQLRADNALAFYANPAKALQGVKKKPGFRKPRTMR